MIPSATWEHLDMNLDLYRQVVARQVTPAGGTVATLVGISLTIPAGALNDSADVIVNDIGAPTQAMPGTRSAVRALTLDAWDGAGQPVTQLVQPLTLVVTYTDEELREPGLNEETIDLVHWNGEEWAPLLPCTGCSIDRANNRITVVIDHFSEFAVTASARLFLPVVQSN